jgi:hypothetical protein
MSNQNSPIVGDDEAVQRLRYFVPRPSPSAIPTPNIFDEPLVGFCINAEWAAHFRGVFEALDQPDTWLGTDEEIYAARQQLAEAFLVFMGECDMCCGEEIELLQQMIVQNETIITNLTTIVVNQNTTIDNSQVVINQNDQTIIEQATNIYNNQVINNQNMTEYNTKIYDGTPQSIAPNLGENFDSDGGDDAICGAVKAYIDKVINDYSTRVNLQALAFSIAAGAATALFTLVTAGAGLPLAAVAWGFLSTTAVAGSAGLWNAIAADEAAKRKVYCCMIDSLRGAEITQDNFKTAVLDCGFDPTTSEGRIAGLIQNESNNDGNYLAFLRALGANAGHAADCNCDCEDELILEDPTYGTVITSLGNCIFRFVQTTITMPDNQYYAQAQDSLGRCIRFEVVEGYEGQSDDGYAEGDGCCGDDDFTGTGGFTERKVTRVLWSHNAGDRPSIDSRYKVTLVPPEECE